jgi:Ca2+-binding RTX toxin-like protein
VIVGGDGNDSERGGHGDDTAQGGAGNDALNGEDGSDALDGGAGDDTLDGGTGADSIAGGDGADLASYASRTAGVTVTLDGSPGDGEPGENDNVQPDVENLSGGSGGDTFYGSGAANRLDGGGGEDYEDGGPGADTLIGGDAGDVLRTRGGDGDVVSCGAGPDFVIAKPTDQVSADCDRVDRGVNQKPKLRDSAVVAPAGGTLQMSPAGIARRVPLQDKVVLALRSVVDSAVGKVRVTSAVTKRRSQSITLDDGAFNITQTRAALAVTQFALQGGDFSGCATGPVRRASSAQTKSVRRLWAAGKGKFRTRGRYAAATVRGTKWMTEDRCDGTLIRVASGAVVVQDLVRRRTVIVRRGGRYFARK